jgi:cytochrome c oxidase assembly protein subunit 15
LNIKQISWTAKVVVALVFCLIFVGGLVTSWQAGMAVPDWPLSFGSLNPEGWWANFPVRLEHGHRLLAAFVGLGVGVLCSLVWGNVRALAIAALVSLLAGGAGVAFSLDAPVRAHLGVWPAAIAFAATLILGAKSRQSVGGIGKFERALALGAFILVCLQATLGGLRVTQETAGLVSLAVKLRITHGCVAQAFLVVLSALTVRLSLLAAPRPLYEPRFDTNPTRLVGFALLLVYCQLILGATMRHLGAGLAIPTFPAANPNGGWMPAAHNLYTDLNFGHTRLGALIVLCVVLYADFRAMRASKPGRPIWLVAWRSSVIVICQALLGIFVVLHHKPKTLATLHVVLGAGLLSSLSALWVHLHTRFTLAEASSEEGR